jgi:hypothetical protein
MVLPSGKWALNGWHPHYSVAYNQVIVSHDQKTCKAKLDGKLEEKNVLMHLNYTFIIYIHFNTP